MPTLLAHSLVLLATQFQFPSWLLATLHVCFRYQRILGSLCKSVYARYYFFPAVFCTKMITSIHIHVGKTSNVHAHSLSLFKSNLLASFTQLTTSLNFMLLVNLEISHLVISSKSLRCIVKVSISMVPNK